MTQTKPRVLITDAEARASLAACRALHSSGYEVDAVAASRPAVSHWSRSCSGRLTAPDPRLDRQGFADALAEILATRDYDVLIPGSDASLLVISEQREWLGPARTGLPSHDVVTRCLAKASIINAAHVAGIDSPQTEICGSFREAADAADQFGFPVLVKPWTSVAPAAKGIRQRASGLAEDAGELERMVGDFPTPVLVQRRLDGPVHSFAGVRADGETLAIAFSRYTRTWPPQAGPVSCSESLQVPPDLRDRAGEMLEVLGWQGIFELEFVRENGRFAAIDLNPRPYGSLELANRAGAPLAAVWCDWLLERHSRYHEAGPGVRYRWEDTEARNLAQRLRSGKVGEAWEVLRPRAGTAHAHFRMSDPAPLLARFIAIVRSRRGRAPTPRGTGR
jgi:predicted ATP-grasp superfamily ATP-dependent carboligase